MSICHLFLTRSGLALTTHQEFFQRCVGPENAVPLPPPICRLTHNRQRRQNPRRASAAPNHSIGYSGGQDALRFFSKIPAKSDGLRVRNAKTLRPSWPPFRYCPPDSSPLESFPAEIPMTPDATMWPFNHEYFWKRTVRRSIIGSTV